MEFKPGDTVAFSQSVVRRVLHPMVSSARGKVIGVRWNIVSVDFGDTYIPHQDGGTVRHIPAGNLTRILASGAVFGD